MLLCVTSSTLLLCAGEYVAPEEVERVYTRSRYIAQVIFTLQVQSVFRRTYLVLFGMVKLIPGFCARRLSEVLRGGSGGAQAGRGAGVGRTQEHSQSLLHSPLQQQGAQAVHSVRADRAGQGGGAKLLRGTERDLSSPESVLSTGT